jgi:hypothetical protein
MKRIFLLFVFCLVAPVVYAQLTPDQKVADFQQIAALFTKRYAFLEWKKQALSFDGLELRPWMERIRNSKDDLEYLEIAAEYLASFSDGHTGLILPTDFLAELPFEADLYDGKALIDLIDREKLPSARYPFDVGDELVAIDGVAVGEILKDLGRFLPEGNPRSARRVAAMYLTYRPQAILPRAHLLGNTATIVVKRRNGNSESYSIPWIKSGDPYPFIGPVPSPIVSSKVRTLKRADAIAPALKVDPKLDEFPVYMRNSRKLQVMRSRKWIRASQGIGQINPVFILPESFVQRVGTGRFDDFFSGMATVNNRKIGYLRLPTFEGFSRSSMEREIAFFEENAEGLIVDVSRNPGGFVCEAERLLRHFAPKGIRTAGNSVRATWEWIQMLQSDLESAKQFNATPDEIAELELEIRLSREAYAQSRGFTEPLPFCGFSLELAPAVDRSGNPVVFTKPLMVLVDDRSASAAELFAAVLQDEGRATVFGLRTAGAGGAVAEFPAGVYSETTASLAWTKLVRRRMIGGTEYPAAPYVENIGVRPNILEDYMTEENLRTQGGPFVKRLFEAMVEYVNARIPR